MSLSRKRRKELKRLRSSAEELWGNQQHLLEEANAVAREASRQLGHFTREEVVPRARTGYESYVRPRMEQARSVAKGAGDTLERTVGNALGSVLSIGDIANDARVRRAVERISPRAATVVQPIVEGTNSAIKQLDSVIKSGKTGVSEEKQALDCVLVTKDNVDSVENFVISE